MITHYVQNIFFPFLIFFCRIILYIYIYTIYSMPFRPFTLSTGVDLLFVTRKPNGIWRTASRIPALLGIVVSFGFLCLSLECHSDDRIGRTEIRTAIERTAVPGNRAFGLPGIFRTRPVCHGESGDFLSPPPKNQRWFRSRIFRKQFVRFRGPSKQRIHYNVSTDLTAAINTRLIRFGVALRPDRLICRHVGRLKPIVRPLKLKTI